MNISDYRISAKKCPGCSIVKSAEEFRRNAYCHTGLNGYCKVCTAEQRRKRYADPVNRENKKTYAREWAKIKRRRDPNFVLSQRRRSAKYCLEHRDEVLAHKREYMLRKKKELREEFLVSYGGMCVCCGESEPVFLTLEHVNRDGKAHRMLVGQSNVLRDLKKRGWPQEGYTILCWNCNSAKRFGRKCPHELAKRLLKSV